MADRLAHDCSRRRKNSKDGKQCRDRLELLERSILVDWDVRSRARCAPQVSFQHGRAQLGLDLFEQHALGTPVAQDCVARRSLHVLDPGHVGPMIRYEVSFPAKNRHHERQRNRPTGTTPRHLQCDEIIRCDATCEHGGHSSIEHAGQGILALSPIEPMREASHQEGECQTDRAPVYHRATILRGIGLRPFLDASANSHRSSPSLSAPIEWWWFEQ